LISEYYFSIPAGAMWRRSVMLWASPTLSYFLRIKFAAFPAGSFNFPLRNELTARVLELAMRTGKLARITIARSVTWRGIWRSHAKQS
jgi:hypothetical protein